MDSSGSSTVIFARISKRISRRNVRDFARRIHSTVARGRAFTCLISDDEYLCRLNLQYRGVDQATDVLSFPSQSGDLGDIAISLDRAVAQARDFGHSAEEEIAVLMLHGVLHLLGMDHERDNGRMRRAESRWRKLLGLPSSLIERVGT